MELHLFLDTQYLTMEFIHFFSDNQLSSTCTSESTANNSVVTYNFIKVYILPLGSLAMNMRCSIYTLL